LYVRIDQTDTKLLELLSTVVDPAARDQLTRDMQKLQVDIGGVDSTIRGLDSQIALIKDQLAHNEDPDLVQQLAQLSATRAEQLPGPGDCVGIKTPGDYETLQAALSALHTVGGTLCLAAGDHTATSLYPVGPHVRFEIAGAGEDKTRITTSLTFNFASQCDQCG